MTILHNLRGVLAVASLLLVTATATYIAVGDDPGSAPTAMRCMKTPEGSYVCTAP